MAYDPTNEAVVRDMLLALAVPEEDTQVNYVDLLRLAQGKLVELVAQAPEDVTPDQENAVAQALGRLHPSADDALADHGTRLRRLQARVDMELFKWTSGMVQTPGPSGAAVVAEPQTLPVSE